MKTDNAGNIPFQVFDMKVLERSSSSGERGTTIAHTLQLSGLRIRLVEYSKGYLADHWCKKGHILYILEGSVQSELKSGEIYELKPEMFYVVSDELSEHRSRTESGAKLLIIDGDFLKLR